MATTEQAELARTAIAAVRSAFGTHPGRRALHAKGSWAEGELTATPAGTALCRAPFLDGTPVRAVVRFSHGSGDPLVHDGGRAGRGIAVKLFLADGSRTDLLGITAPAFVVRRPEDFPAFVEATKRDPATGAPDMDKLGAFIAAHPESLTAIQAAPVTPPPASYLSIVYNGIHSFRWTAPDGSRRWVRTRWVPKQVEVLEDADAMARDPDYLSADLRDRIKPGAATLTLVAHIAGDGDPIDDPTAAWPEERESVEVAHLVLRKALDDPETASDIRVFDPTRVCDGIELSADPILLFRSAAYDVSARGRWSG
ncbi:MAG TPA: catalase family peroxidase [Mycobacteriales bacterium]|nr:catalase family peroxidase [Mycobacteriales bacterium]